MSASTGDKSRHNRQRRKKLARRVSARKLQATLSSNAEPERARQRDRQDKPR